MDLGGVVLGEGWIKEGRCWVRDGSGRSGAG